MGEPGMTDPDLTNCPYWVVCCRGCSASTSGDLNGYGEGYEAGQVAMRESAARFIEKRRDDYIADHGNYDWSTGATEFPGNGEEWVGEQDETAEAIRALPVAPSVKRAGT